MNGHPLSAMTEDYTFLMARLPDETRVVSNAGPAEQRFGAWARILPAGQTIQLRLDEAFAQSLAGGQATIIVTYLDEGAGSFALQTPDRGIQRIDLAGSRRWQEASWAIPGNALVGHGTSANLVLRGLDGEGMLHMVAVERFALKTATGSE